VLGETVRYFKELKKLVNEIPTTPSLEDSLRLGQCKNIDFARVVFSCSDREGLMSEVAESMKAADAKAVRAEMMTVGGRTKCVLFVQGVNGNEGKGEVNFGDKLKPINDEAKAWKTVWSAGQGVGQIGDLPSVDQLIARLDAEFRQA